MSVGMVGEARELGGEEALSMRTMLDVCLPFVRHWWVKLDGT